MSVGLVVLDGDGLFSTFERSGAVGANGSAGLYVDLEQE